MNRYHTRRLIDIVRCALHKHISGQSPGHLCTYCIDTKAIASQIRISSKYAHMFHRLLIIQAALAPMYAHAFMAFGSTPEVNKQIAELIKKGMWT